MYRTLFDLAGLAIVAWLPLIFLPTWRWTRRLAESAFFPAYLAILYVVGVVLVFRDVGFGVMGDFGTADGVLRVLASEPVAMIAWIHILAFDQVVGLLIYRDNIRHRYVPLPVQSVLLFLTLMLGPLGFLGYYLARMARRRSGWVAWGERWDPATSPVGQPVRFDSVVTERNVVGALTALWKRERAIVAIAIAGFVLAGVAVAGAAVNGGWRVGAEGDLLEAAKFEFACALFYLTMAALVPLAGFTERVRRRWVAALVALSLYFLPIEVVQALRGLDPRFTEVGGVVDQVAGVVFGVTALALIVLFVILARRFFRVETLPDHPNLKLAIRYGAIAAGIAFGIGLVMSGLNGRVLASGGNVMPVHAAGFHGLQAVPLVALLLGWSRLDPAQARVWVHMAGVSWTLLCVGLLGQALIGAPTLAPTAASGLAVAGVFFWVCALAYAVAARRITAPAPAGR